MTRGREPGVKIEIGVAKDPCDHYDFGVFDSKTRIKVNRYWWSQYVEKRKEFELLHQELVNYVNKKKVSKK